MKCLLIAITALFLAPVTSLAISLSEITGNPDQYMKVWRNETVEVYWDTSSIESIRYDPPYYTLRTKTYVVTYNLSEIIEQTATFNYNYNQCSTKLISELIKMYPSDTFNTRMNRLATLKESNSGVTYNLTDSKVWSFDGDYKDDSLYPVYDINAEYNSSYYWISSFMFARYYQEPF